MLTSTVSRYEALEFLYSHVKTKSPDYIRALRLKTNPSSKRDVFEEGFIF